MKICWDNLEGFRLTKNKTFAKGSSTYVYRDSCKECGHPYLTRKSDQSEYCCKGHATVGNRNPFYGKRMSEELKNKLYKLNKGSKKSTEFKNHLSKINKGSGNKNYKGGVKKLNKPLYDSYYYKLNFAEDTRIDIVNNKYLEVRCSYCGCWFIPKTSAVIERIKGLKGQGRGERRLYCSDGCKKACPIYRRKKYPKGFKKSTSREVQPELRQMVLERDNYKCQICGKNQHEVELHCHHITGVEQNPIESADVDNCITLCKEHHKIIHKQKDCRYFELKCN